MVVGGTVVVVGGVVVDVVLVVEVLLALGAPHEAAEAAAEGMEHFVSEPTRAAMSEFLRLRRIETAS